MVPHDNAGLQRAYGYPYAAPPHDYVFTEGRAETFRGEVDLSERHPVIAVGSNRAPEQLRRKFGIGPGCEIPVTWAWMHGYDVVYCAHLAGYGSVPATLHSSPGTEVRVAVTWLTESQLARMHETENVGESYVYGTFEEEVIDLGDGRPVRRAGCYITRRGALALEGSPVALAEVEARNRRFVSLGQRAKLAAVHRYFGDRPDLEEWILSMLGEENRERRAALAVALGENVAAFEDPRFTIVLG
ncbi:hypothetical protein NUH88_09760 [Nisaea acidiphila]|uniref:Uncharacterized protein n=1 Tax=Nisaea acidiphila TaxID=1862145 RepID=A0A9J7B0G5_9PROT|nr:hypothetical protein [Nisaea acidiphila]UUX51972.1 hypothetical protein NUH88_09760 [Nisaea acidiphila]